MGGLIRDLINGSSYPPRSRRFIELAPGGHGRSGRRRAVAAVTVAVVAFLAWLVPISPAQASDPVLAAAGDIACPAGSTTDAGDCQQASTASLISAHSPTAIAVLGDEQYVNGTLAEFEGAGAYGATWGALNSISHPVPGNHEYAASSTADGYFTYFGEAAVSRNGYYSYDVGGWHVIALNSNCGDGQSGVTCSNREGGDGTATSAEVQWLQNDLAAHQGQCTLAYWHHPRFSQGSAGGSASTQPLWDALYAHGADKREFQQVKKLVMLK